MLIWRGLLSLVHSIFNKKHLIRSMLEQELEKFRQIQGTLKQEHPNGGFVVIKGDEILGVWNDRIDALRQGLEKYGDVQFLVKNIMDDNTVINFSRPLQFV